MERIASSAKVVGIKQTRNALSEKKARVVYTAEDVAPGMLDEIIKLCEAEKTERIVVPTRKELAKLCKVDVPCAAAALLNDNHI